MAASPIDASGDLIHPTSGMLLPNLQMSPLTHGQAMTHNAAGQDEYEQAPVLPLLPAFGAMLASCAHGTPFPRALESSIWQMRTDHIHHLLYASLHANTPDHTFQ